MGQSSDVIAAVETDSGVYTTKKNVKVTIGGCGG
jgi:sulfur-oxidizing protein SoxY